MEEKHGKQGSYVSLKIDKKASGSYEYIHTYVEAIQPISPFTHFFINKREGHGGESDVVVLSR
mgnify:CR=1 FL=1|jgi:hypothetical protein